MYIFIVHFNNESENNFTFKIVIDINTIFHFSFLI